MLQVSRTAARVDPSAARIADLRAHFDRHHWARLPGVLSRDLLADVQSRLAHAAFV